ncbi:MAG: 2-dehydro-3-deoxygalactonokinase [Pseudomonadota bacterium]|uniref:2-dehydro-3-deoxygalactonokinase n=1 Tax=Roseovarius salincola TaxID=2978479 RepID=UPI0022A720F9|nr:2-dehydro-3-deoxygalactonokinase [Roseovarius sp. EGI FJ00037]MCZ0811161.1 2-dehydro-3-deoxygalactonokinase [Roseovarius sp. EGI FJ00037]
MTDWIAIGRDGAQVSAHAMRGARLIQSVRAADESGALTALKYDAAQQVRIGDGAPDPLPAPVLPKAAGAALPGLAQKTPPDVIGARVRLWIAGLLARQPGWDGVVCALEDGVNHWIQISAGEAVSTQSFLTPRLVAALGGTAPPAPEAIADSLSRPERLAAHLRVAEVSNRPDAISGHLLGAELAAARPYWLGQKVALIAPDGAAPGLDAALRDQGVPVELHSRESLLADGLGALARAFELND